MDEASIDPQRTDLVEDMTKCLGNNRILECKSKGSLGECKEQNVIEREGLTDTYKRTQHTS